MANWNPTRFGQYLARTKECHLRKLPVPENARFVTVHCYAQILVHEATHGFLHKKRFVYSRATIQRIEDLCKKEEMRFLLKLRSDDKERWDIAFAYQALLEGKKHSSTFRFVFEK